MSSNNEMVLGFIKDIRKTFYSIKAIIDDPNGNYDRIRSKLYDLMIDEFKRCIEASSLESSDRINLLRWAHVIEQCITDINAEATTDTSPFQKRVLSIIKNKEIEDIENRIKTSNE